MTVERSGKAGGALVFTCDNCGEEHNTREKEWNTGLAIIRDRGWTATNRSGTWQHFCPDCED